MAIHWTSLVAAGVAVATSFLLGLTMGRGAVESVGPIPLAAAAPAPAPAPAPASIEAMPAPAPAGTGTTERTARSEPVDRPAVDDPGLDEDAVVEAGAGCDDAGDIALRLDRLADLGPDALAVLHDDPSIVATLRRLDGQAIALLAGLVERGEGTERQLAVALLGSLGDPRAVGILEAVLGEGPAGDVVLRRSAAVALAFLASEAAVPALRRTLATAADPVVRLEVADGLALLGRADGLAALRDLLDDRHLSDEVFLRLASLGDPGSFDLFRSRLLEPGEPGPRLAALRALGGARDPATLDALRRVAFDPSEDRFLAAEARRLLEEAGGS